MLHETNENATIRTVKLIIRFIIFFILCSPQKYYKARCAFCQAFCGTMCYYFYMITIEEIQKRMREAIQYSNITQKELAEKLGINPSTVSKYMRLDKYPSLDTFANICQILDVSADEIFGLKK